MKTVNDYFGLTDSDRIEAAMKEMENGIFYLPRRVCDVEPERDYWLIDRAILIPANTTVILQNCKIKLSDACRDNFFRSANCGIGINPILPIDNIHIKGVGVCVLEGADHPRATGDGGKILANPCPKNSDDLLKYADWISDESRAAGRTNFDEEHSHSFGTDAGNPNESPLGDWRGIGILFARATHFSIENLSIICSHGWGISLEDCSFGTVQKIDFDSCMAKTVDGMLQNTENQDGIDVRNGCHHILINDITGGTGDDLIALTAIADSRRPRPDGAVVNTTHVMSNDWTKRDPNIHDIIIRNVMGYSKGGICFLIRLLPANAKIWNVVIDGVVDTSPEGFNPGGVLLLGSGDGEYGKNPVDGMKYITVSNMICNSHRAVIVGGYISDSSFSNIINRNPDSPVVAIYRKEGFKDVEVSGLVSVNGRLVEDRCK